MVTKSQDHSLAVYPRAEFEDARRTADAGIAEQSGGPRLPAKPGRGHRRAASRRTGPDHAVGRPPPLREPHQGVRRHRFDRRTWRSGTPRPGRTTRQPTKRTSPRPAMKLCATSSDPGQPARTGPCIVASARTDPGVLPRRQVRDLGQGPRCRGTRFSSEAAARDAMSDDHADSSDAPHVPVLLDRCVELLTPALTRHSADGIAAPSSSTPRSARAGTPSDSSPTCPACDWSGLDRDPTALAIAGERLAPFGDRVTLSAPATTATGPTAPSRRWTASCSTSASRRCSWTEPNAASPTRRTRRWTCGWIRTRPLTAADILNTYDEKALARILREFGEERFACRIAAEIVRRRARKPFTTTGELVELLYAAIPVPARRTGGHPAKRTFQALRTAVNGELDSLRDGAARRNDALPAGGRIVVMAYQSLEDKIVKSAVRRRHRVAHPVRAAGRTAGPRAGFRRTDPGAEKADAVEIELNPRSASVRLRALEKVDREGKIRDGQADQNPCVARTSGERPERDDATARRRARRRRAGRGRRAISGRSGQGLRARDQPDPAAHRGAGRPKNAAQAKARAKARKAKAPKVVRCHCGCGCGNGCWSSWPRSS